MAFTPASFDYIRALLADLSAIALDDDKTYLVESRLMPVARQAGLSSIDDLVTRLRLAPDQPLRQQVVDAMTTNETSFFRDEVPFKTLRTIILPDLLARRAAVRNLNIWSVGCASGQEPYSIAILWREYFSQLNDWTPRLLGTDLSKEVLERARTGRFTQLEVSRGLPVTLLRKYFRQIDTDWQIDRSIREMVEFRGFNLCGDWPALPKMDVILLRNVLVYFDLATRQEILRRIWQAIRADGYLLLGGAETAIHIDAKFEVTRCDGFSYFRPRLP